MCSILILIFFISDITHNKENPHPYIAPKNSIFIISNKTVLKPRVSPAFAITYFYNYYYIGFMN